MKLEDKIDLILQNQDNLSSQLDIYLLAKPQIIEWLSVSDIALSEGFNSRCSEKTT
ncbi:MAG: hypothetical protein Q9M91_07210 [Candidatus Dojkabacteria bacterium]|nr:hypothetical protein [Candidatus Dojkabacteria bacterium]